MKTDEENRAAFDKATYYDCEDAETLRHESVEEMLEEQFSGDTDDIMAAIARLCPVTVRAYVKKEVPPIWAANAAGSLMDHFEEDFLEEYGNPDGECQITDSMRFRLAELIGSFVAELGVWQCDEVASRVFGAAEVEAMMRVYAPDWFEEADAKRAAAAAS